MCRAILAVVFAASVAAAADSVWTEPARPTTRDSITFHLFLENNCCCTQYYGSNVVVDDSVIYLSYEFDTRNCMLCDCFAAGSWTIFESAPLAAGSYAIYNAGQVYCPPGEICPLGIMLPVRVGEITVRAPVSTARRPSLSTRIAAGSVTLYTLDGRPVNGKTPSGVVVGKSGVRRAIFTR